MADNVILVIATSMRTGKTVFVETVTLVDDLRRVRTVQVGCCIAVWVVCCFIMCCIACQQLG